MIGAPPEAPYSLARHALLALYDNLGRAVLVNLIWAVTSLPWLGAGIACAWSGRGAAEAFGVPGLQLLGFGTGLVLAGLSPPSLFVFAVTASWARGSSHRLGQAWSATRGQLFRAQAAGLLAAALVAILLGNALFYQRWGGWLGLGLSGFMLWLVFGLLLAVQYLFPLLLERPDAPLRRVLRQCVLLAIGNLRRSVLLLAAAAVVGLLGAVSVVGLALGLVPALALLWNVGLFRILERYGGRPLPRDRRGLGDLLRPWS